MLVDSSKVSVMSLSAGSTVPDASTAPQRRLVDGAVGVAPPGGVITGDVQADFVVLCNSAADRQAATKKVLSMSSQPLVRQRFVAALAHISSVDPDHIHGVMLDRQWSRSAAGRSKASGDGSLTVVSSKVKPHQSSLGGFGFLLWPLVALASAALVALVACAACGAYRTARSQGQGFAVAHVRGKEAQALLSGNGSHDWSDDEPEKGEVPDGVLGFNPKNFSPEKFRSTGISEADQSDRSFSTPRSQKRADAGTGPRGMGVPHDNLVPAPPNLGANQSFHSSKAQSFLHGNQPRPSFVPAGSSQAQSFATNPGSQPQSFATINPQSFNFAGSQQSFRPGYGH